MLPQPQGNANRDDIRSTETPASYRAKVWSVVNGIKDADYSEEATKS